jgi:dihydrofolate reductase
MSNPPLKKIILAAMAANRVIGAGGRIPWHYTSDMRHVKETTTGFPCIMGRKTYESFPRRPLPGRQNIVLTRSTGYQVAAEVKICAGLAEATTWCGNLGAEKVFILGGEEVYRLALAEADEMLITLVPDDVAGDTLFPEWDPRQWREVNRRQGEEGLQFVTYRRSPAFVTNREK